MNRSLNKMFSGGGGGGGGGGGCSYAQLGQLCIKVIFVLGYGPWQTLAAE